MKPSLLSIASPSLALLVFASCAAVEHAPLAPLAVARHEPLKLVVEAGRTGLQPASANVRFEAFDVDTPLMTLSLKLYAVEPECVGAAFGANAAGLAALACSRAEAQRFEGDLARVGAANIDGPSQLTLYDGQRASVSVARQEAYVADFELTANEGSTIADPRIDTVFEGVLFVATAKRDQSAHTTAIDVELTVCRLDHPFAEHEVELFEHALPVTIQVPNGISRRLTAHTVLAADEALVFGGVALPVDAHGRVLIAVLRADPAVAN